MLADGGFCMVTSVPESRRFAVDVGMLFFASIVSVMVGFVIVVVMGRYLGPGDLGLYRMVSTVYGIIMLGASMGLPAAVTKYIAEQKADRTVVSRYVSTGILLSLGVGICFTLLMAAYPELVGSLFDMPGLTDLLRVLSPVYPFALIGGVLLGLFNGIREMKYYALSIVIQSGVMAVVTLGLIVAGAGVAGAVIGIVASWVASTLYLLLMSRQFFSFTLEGFVSIAKSLMRFGFQMLTAGAINDINNELDVLFVGFFLTSTDVGLYAVAVMVSRFFGLIPLSVQKITYAATSSHWQENNYAALHKMTDKSMKYCSVLLLLGGLCVTFFAHPIIIGIFGSEFQAAILPVQILLAGMVIRGGIGTSVGGSIAAIGRPDLSMWVNAVMLVINGSLNLLFIPQFGITGAALATFVSLVGGAVLYVGLLVKYLYFEVDYRWFGKIYSLAFTSFVIYTVGATVADATLVGTLILLIFAITIYSQLLSSEDKNLFKDLIHSIASSR